MIRRIRQMIRGIRQRRAWFRRGIGGGDIEAIGVVDGVPQADTGEFFTEGDDPVRGGREGLERLRGLWGCRDVGTTA
jgi:hypothetical protein